MTSSKQVNIVPLKRVNDLEFGMDQQSVFGLWGEPDKTEQNYTGETEHLFGNYILRFEYNRLVECTFPGTCHFAVEAVRIISIAAWLRAQPDVAEKARFLISPKLGMAWDHRLTGRESLTVFEAGRWDHLLS